MMRALAIAAVVCTVMALPPTPENNVVPEAEFTEEVQSISLPLRKPPPMPLRKPPPPMPLWKPPPMPLGFRIRIRVSLGHYYQQWLGSENPLDVVVGGGDSIEDIKKRIAYEMLVKKGCPGAGPKDCWNPYKHGMMTLSRPARPHHRAASLAFGNTCSNHIHNMDWLEVHMSRDTSPKPPPSSTFPVTVHLYKGVDLQIEATEADTAEDLKMRIAVKACSGRPCRIPLSKFVSHMRLVKYTARSIRSGGDRADHIIGCIHDTVHARDKIHVMWRK